MEDTFERISLKEALQYLEDGRITIYYKSKHFDEDIVKFDIEIVPTKWSDIAYILLSNEFYIKTGGDFYD